MRCSIQLAFGIIAASLLAACQTDKPAPVIDVAPLSSQIGALAQANADLRAANERLTQANVALQTENERLKSQLRSDADAGLAANEKGWLPFEGYVWRQQIARLPSVQPDASTVSKWTEASGLYAAGGESAMQGVINTLNADAKKTNETLGQLLSQTEQLTKERDAANEAATAALARVQKAEEDLSAAVEKARQDEAQAIRMEQVRFCNRWGGFAALAALAAGISAYWLGTIGLVLFGGMGLSSMILFGAARFLSSPWFGWTAGAVVIVGVIAAIVLVWRKQRKASMADRYASFGVAVVPELDRIYENKSSMKDWLTQHPDATQSDFIELEVFDILSKKMDASTKAVVDEIRASIKLEASDSIPQ